MFPWGNKALQSESFGMGLNLFLCAALTLSPLGFILLALQDNFCFIFRGAFMRSVSGLWVASNVN